VGATNNGTSLVHRLHKHVLSLINDFRSIRLVKEQQYDFIQVKDKFIAAIICIFLSRLANLKFFFWLSYPFPEADIYEYKTGTARYPYLYFIRGMFFKLLLYNFILPFSDHIFVQSERMKKEVSHHGLPPDIITPIPMGVDLDDNAPKQDSDQHTLESDMNSIIYLGSMQKVRRIDLVIRVFKKVLDTIPDARLYMVGGSENVEDLDFLKEEAKKLKVDHATIFTGNLPRKKALEYVSRASIGLSPIYPSPILDVGSPTKLIEYMVMGKPVVANDHPDQKQIIDESKAGLCVMYEEDAFAIAILNLLKNREKAVLMGKQGKEYILEKRSYRIIADTVEKRYYTLLS
jgi:glycosyltransferase involved in cell wall biosynthesis